MKNISKAIVAALLMLLPLPYSSVEAKGGDINVVGHVIDRRTGEHLPFISIVLKGTTLGTATDESGHYFLKGLPAGKARIEASFIGYRTVMKEVLLEDGITAEVNFEMEEDPIALETVVVSANRAETTRKMAPTLVNVLSPELFENTNASCAAQGLNFQPGVRVENNCQNCGFQQVRINGLDGPYTQILIDSRPIMSALSGVYGLEQIPANMIDRVEVMRGGGSALFGASAIAGTINIITREPARNSAQFMHTSTNLNGKDSFDHNTMLNASLVSDNNRLGLAVFGQNRERDGYDHDGDGFTELPRINSQTIGMRSFIKTGLHSKLTAEYHHLQEYRRGGDLLDRPPHEAMVAEEVKHSINTAGLNFSYFSPDERHSLNVYASMQHVDRDSYYGGAYGKSVEDAVKAYGATSDLTFVTGAQYRYRFHKCLFMPADLTVGMEYNQDDLHDTMWGYGRDFSQGTKIASMFFQNEWKNGKWGFLLGGRLDKHNLLKNVVFSPRANIRYNPTENVNLRASYSFGFRAPQAFDEDLHVDNVGGMVSMIRLDGNLREEKSQSVSVSADMYHSWGDWQGNLLVEGFFSDLSDVFALTDIGVENGVLIRLRHNEKGAMVYGGNLEGKVAYRSLFQMQAGLTLQRAEYKEARAWSDAVEKTRRMFRTPDLYGYMTATVNPLEQLSVSLSGTYTGSMLVEHHAGFIPEDRTEKTPGFFDMNMKISYDFRLYKVIGLQLFAGAQNIFNSYQSDFDKGPERDSGYIYGPGMPRSFYLGLKLSY